MGRLTNARSFLCASLTLVLGSCYSDFPLDLTPQAPLDSNLLGSWRCLPPDPEPDDSAATLAFSEARDRVYGIRFEEGDGKDPGLFEAHVSRVGKQSVLNVRLLDPEAPKPWAFARYSFLLPHVLHVQYLDEGALKGVQNTPVAFRQALDDLPVNSSFWKDYAVCVRTDHR